MLLNGFGANAANWLGALAIAIHQRLSQGASLLKWLSLSQSALEPLLAATLDAFGPRSLRDSVALPLG